METGLYVSLSAQVTREARLNTIAENIANSQTVGFKRRTGAFEEVVEDVSGEDVSFASQGVEYLNATAGGLEQTGNPLDFAVRGNAWFGVETPAGTVVTRDGRFTMVDNGDLVTLSGYPVLDPGGAPITLDPAGGVPELGRQRHSSARTGRLVARSACSHSSTGPDFQRFGNSGIVVGGEPEPIVDNPDVGIVQGHVELSNVNYAATR
jgi:flagellar basal-body rod protein FlgF